MLLVKLMFVLSLSKVASHTEHDSSYNPQGGEPKLKSIPFRVVLGGISNKKNLCGDALVKTWEVCKGLHNALRAIGKLGLVAFQPSQPVKPPPQESRAKHFVDIGGHRQPLTDGELDHGGCGGRLFVSVGPRRERVCKAMVSEGAL
jgi:hypothetical protein